MRISIFTIVTLLIFVSTFTLAQSPKDSIKLIPHLHTDSVKHIRALKDTNDHKHFKETSSPHYPMPRSAANEFSYRNHTQQVTREGLSQLADALSKGRIDSVTYRMLYQQTLAYPVDIISEEIDLEEARMETIQAETEKAKIELEMMRLKLEKLKLEKEHRTPPAPIEEKK